MSLVPPVHFVLLDAAAIYDNLLAAMTAERWADGLPTNALLISGPSKTADIQQTLAYGAHGPKELIVLLMPPRRELTMTAARCTFIPREGFARPQPRAAVDDAHLRQSFRGAMDFLQAKRAAQFPDPAELSSAARRSARRSASTAWRACPSCSSNSSAS